MAPLWPTRHPGAPVGLTNLGSTENYFLFLLVMSLIFIHKSKENLESGGDPAGHITPCRPEGKDLGLSSRLWQGTAHPRDTLGLSHLQI